MNCRDEDEDGDSHDDDDYAETVNERKQNTGILRQAGSKWL